MNCEEFLSKAAELIDNASRIALRIEDKALRDGALAVIASKAVILNQFEKARKLLDDVSDEELKARTYRNIAVHFASRGYIHEASQAMKQVPYEELKIDALKAAVSYLIPRGHVREALRVIESIQTSEFKDELLKFIVDKMVENNKLDDVDRIIELIHDPVYRASARNSYITALVRQNKVLDPSLWSKTLSDIALIKDTIVIREKQAFLRYIEVVNKKLLELENLYFALEKAGSSESSRILGLIVNSVNEIQDPEDRIDILRSLIRNAAFSNELVGIPPIVDQAFRELQGVENPLIISQVLKDLGMYYISRGDHAKARELIKQAIDAANKIDEIFQRDAFFKELVEDLLKLGVYEFLEETMEKFSEPRYKIEAMCEYAIKVADNEKAAEIVSRSHKEVSAIKNPVWLAHLLQRILEVQLVRKVGDVNRTFNVLLKVVDLIDSEYSKATILASLAETLYRTCTK